MPSKVLLVALNINSNDASWDRYAALSAAEKIIMIRNRIRVICENLKRSHPDDMWVFTWRENAIFDNLKNTFVWDEMQRQFIREMEQLSKHYHPNLKIIAGAIRTRETMPNKAHLDRIKRQYHAHKWAKFTEEDPAQILKGDYFDSSKKDKDLSWENFLKTKLDFNRWVSDFLKTKEAELLKTKYKTADDLHIALLGKFIRTDDLYTDMPDKHCLLGYYQYKVQEKNMARVKKQVSMSESSYLSYLDELFHRPQWEEYYQNSIYQSAWRMTLPDDALCLPEYRRLQDKAMHKPLDDKKPSAAAFDAIRNECIGFENGRNQIYGKCFPIAEITSKSRLFDIKARVKIDVENPVVYEPPKKVNQNPIFKFKHPDGTIVTCGVEICREHAFGSLKKLSPRLKPDVHIVMSDFSEVASENIYGSYYAFVDSKSPLYFQKLINLSSDSVQVKMYKNELFCGKTNLVEIAAAEEVKSSLTSLGFI